MNVNKDGSCRTVIRLFEFAKSFTRITIMIGRNVESQCAKKVVNG